MAQTIGIDLGTTNSVVSTLDGNGVPRILTNAHGDTTTPSMVGFRDNPDGSRSLTIGQAAKRQAVTNPEQSVFGVKRLIGRRYDDEEVSRLAQTLPYQIAPAPNGDAWVEIGGTTMSPQEISALVLSAMRQAAEAHFGSAVTSAIITVPAYFNNQQRQATRDAAEIAGLKVRRLLNEPTAAALGYGAHRGANKRFAVCDLGGGTFDVSIVNVENGVFEVISTHGDPFLGGDDFDRAIIEQLIREIERDYKTSLLGKPQALQRLKEAAADAKHTLSATRTTDLNLRFLAKTASGTPFDYQRALKREELEEWTAHIVRRLDVPCREAVARCSLSPHDIDAIILVGGMTRMPAVQARIASIFGRPPLKVVNPDEVVSVGAATQCAILDGVVNGVVLLDVTSRDLMLSAQAGQCQRVIPRNATIPTREHKIIATTRDDQRELSFDIFEGESTNPDDNRHLGKFVCSDLPQAPAGDILILVEFTVDVDGILRVAATELSSGQAPVLRLVATAGLTRSDVRQRWQRLRELNLWNDQDLEK